MRYPCPQAPSSGGGPGDEARCSVAEYPGNNVNNYIHLSPLVKLFAHHLPAASYLTALRR